MYLGADIVQWIGPFKVTIKPEQLKAEYPEQYAAIQAKAKEAAMTYLQEQAAALKENPVFWAIVAALGLVIVGQMLPRKR